MTASLPPRDQGLPLSGIRVLELTHIIAGPFAAAVLADYGADVVKVEAPEGERSRISSVAAFRTFGRNRRSLVLDLKVPEGEAVFRELVKVTDVILENFRPGTMERLGLGYKTLEQINPGLVYVAISGFGRLEPYIGPYSDRQANNATVQAMGGLMELSGDADGPPAFIGQSIGDTIPALWATIGTLIALQNRQRTGKGSFVDVAMYDAIAAMCSVAVTDYHESGKPPSRGGRNFSSISFTTRLKCRDGYIGVSMWGNRPELWNQMWQEIGRPDMLKHPVFDPKRPGLPASQEIAVRVLEEWLAGVDKAKAVDILLNIGFSAGEVQTVDQVYHCAHLAKRQLFVDLDDGLGAPIRTIGSPIKFSAAPPVVSTGAPKLGHDSAEVLSDWLGKGPDQIRTLLDRGAIKTADE